MLSILRGFGVSLTLANQYIAQLDERLQSALIGNVGTTIAFKIGLAGRRGPCSRLRPQTFRLHVLEPHHALVRR